jgi:Ca-activated chloride channel homolog
MVYSFMVRKIFKMQVQSSQLFMKLLAIVAYFSLICSIGVFGQSGRNKSQQETELSKDLKKVVFVPTATAVATPTPSPVPVPLPTPKLAVKDEKEDGVISVESTLIPIPVSVTDSSGKAVIDLKLEDFVFEVDGKTEQLGELSVAETPVRLALLFDNSSSVTQAREFEKKAAIRFFKQIIRPKIDLAALFSVSTGSRLEQPLTPNVSSLVQALENLPEPEGATALLDGIIKAARYLENVEGRRIIVILTDGEDTISDSTLENAVKVLQQTNCQGYIVKTTDFENYKRTGDRTGSANTRSLSAERRMQEIANQTGGAVYSPLDERELDVSFRRISSELSQQYILSYYLNEMEKRGVFRNISLKVKSRTNLTIRTRKGYFISKK